MNNHREDSLKNRFTYRVVKILSSIKFFYVTIFIFILECIWIAFSALYPQAFDENFHFGLIKVYSHYWLPFLTQQPPNTSQYSALTRDPSYLYHYLMSFPYRFIALFVHSMDLRVIIIRLIDSLLFIWAIILFRKLLLKIGLSKSLTNLTFFLFILIPIVPQLAAQVNYDDLLILLVAWLFLQTFNIIDQIKIKKVSFRSLSILFISGTLTCLVKYAFAPILFGIILFLLLYARRKFDYSFKNFLKEFKKSFNSTSLIQRIILIFFIVLSIGLFAQRDGYNLIKYHSFAPDCSKVLSVKECRAYSPWQVDYDRHQLIVEHITFANMNIVNYTHQWFYWMWYRLFFAVNGLASNFYSFPPLPLPSIAALGIMVIGIYSFIRQRKKLLKNPYIVMLLTACGIYLLSLFIKSLATYHYTAYLENMNGRYLLPILLPLGGIIGLAISLEFYKKPIRKALLAVLVVLLFLEGGGVITFIIRSDNSWYWPNSTVKKVNDDAKKITRHTLIRIRKSD